MRERGGDDKDQYSEGPSDDGSGNGEGTEAGQKEKNALKNDPGDEEEGDSPGTNRKSDKTTVVGWDKLGVNNPLDNPPGQVIEDKNGNRIYEGFHSSYLGGIFARPGLFMMNQGRKIVQEGWRGE